MIDIVIYRDNNTVEFGLVKAEKKNKLIISNITGKELSISINKILDKIALNFKSFDDAFKIIKEFYSKKEEFKTKVNIKDLDYKLIKPLIWWE